MDFQAGRLGDTHDDRSISNLAYQNHSGADQCDVPYCEKGGPTPGKQPMSMQLTSGPGERTFSEAALRLNWRTKNLPCRPNSILSRASQSLSIPEIVYSKISIRGGHINGIKSLYRKYQIVFAPKSRRQEIYGGKRSNSPLPGGSNFDEECCRTVYHLVIK